MTFSSLRSFSQRGFDDSPPSSSVGRQGQAKGQSYDSIRMWDAEVFGIKRVDHEEALGGGRSTHRLCIVRATVTPVSVRPKWQIYAFVCGVGQDAGNRPVKAAGQDLRLA